MNLTRLIGSAATALLLTACDADHDFKEAVRAKLSDPFSAEFRDIRRDTALEGIACGMVNAKNKLGGYVGWSRFYARKEHDDWVVIIGDAQDRELGTLCMRAS